MVKLPLKLFQSSLSVNCCLDCEVVLPCFIVSFRIALFYTNYVAFLLLHVKVCNCIHSTLCGFFLFSECPISRSMLLLVFMINKFIILILCIIHSLGLGLLLLVIYSK